MSKKSKSAAKDRRNKEKRSRKAAQRARYEAYKGSGNNSKRSSIRRRKRVDRKVGDKPEHTACGNTGCHKCNVISFKGFVNSQGRSVNMPQWMWQKWQEQKAA